ncbi:ATP-binding protein [Deinococcus sp.]|uniref:ATP-binding protein n=1 Tax=Deinococcus sp. TaxID=47478 RepID=UPI003CC684A9
MDQAQADIEGAGDTEVFGHWVRARRKALWLTQKKLARLVGCAPVTIQKIEEGRRRPSPHVAQTLARHLEIAEEQKEQFLWQARTMPTAPRTAPAPAPLPESGPAEGGLPLSPQPLIGRAEVLADVQLSLLAPAHRLLTLTGPPGVGKTRLALGVADGLRGAFADGVWFVPLAPLDAPEQVWPTVSRSLGLLDGGPAPLMERLIRFLKERQVLLVLDNFEHLPGAALPLAGVMGACPGLRVLVTSRTALRLSGEQEWPVTPLKREAATQLFAERVRAFDPEFALNAQTAPVVAEIVTRLDGLPLAIELAAVRLRYQPPEELVARLRAAPLGALGSGPVDGPDRQSTLHRAIAWSDERLEPRLQQVFRRLGVFVGGLSPEAAQQVAGATPGDLETLLDGHLIRREGRRFTLLETLRAYALERLDAHHETEETQDAHQAYFLTAVQAHQDTDLDWFGTEMGNIRAALRTQVAHGQVEAALRLALGSYWFWETRGYQYEGLEWFLLILKQSEPMAPALRLVGLNTGSTMAWQSGRFDLSRAWLAEGLTLSRHTGDVQWEAKLLMHQGKVELEEGQYVAAQQVLEPALRLARQLSLPWLVCAVLLQLADVRLCLCELGLAELDDVQVLAEEGLALCRQHPGLFWETPLLMLMGLIALERGQVALARQHLFRSLGLVSGTEHRLQLTLILTSFAATLAGPGASHSELLRAARLWSGVEVARDHSGYRWSVAFAERFERWTAQARERLGGSDWELAWKSGRTMTLEEAVAEMLAVQSQNTVQRR